MKSHSHFPCLFARTVGDIVSIWATLLTFDLVQRNKFNLTSIISPHGCKAPFLFTSSFGKAYFSVSDIFRIALGTSLVVWYSATEWKMFSHFISRDRPLVAHSACHRMAALCSSAHRGNCQCDQAFEDPLIKSISETQETLQIRMEIGIVC